MTARPVVRDERTVSTENASYRWAYLVMSFGLLVDVAYRGFALKTQSWDLLALVVLGGVVATTYQGANRVLSRRWLMLSAAAIAIAAVLGAIIALVR